MSHRKTIHCPEEDNDCTDPRCSVKVCISWQARIVDERRKAKQEAELQAQVHAQRRQKDREREALRVQTDRRRAAIRVLHEHVKEHNARIEANEPGIAKGRDGRILTKRVELPHDSKARQALIDLVFERASQETEWAARLERAIAKEKLRQD